MEKEKITDKVKLENVIDDYLTNDVPLSLLTEKYDLSYPQIQLLLNRTRGFSRQSERLSDMLGEFDGEEYSKNYLIIPHEIEEKYPLKSDNQIALFKRLEEIKQLLPQTTDPKELEAAINDLEVKIASYDQKKLSNIGKFIAELESLENANSDNIAFVMRRYGITPTTIAEYNALYEEYQKDLNELNRLKAELLRLKTEGNLTKAYKREYDSIREELVVRNIKLVNWCIRRFFNDIPLPKDETQLFGVEGLVRAINKFDYKMKFHFSTYAVPTIVHHIERHFDELYGMEWRDFIAKESIKYYRRLIREEDPGRTVDATPTELADTGLTKLSARQIAGYDEMIDLVLPNADIYEPMEIDLKPTRRNEMPISFEDYAAIDDYEDKTSVASDVSFTEVSDARELERDIRKVISTLTIREEEVLTMRYGLDDGHQKSLETIGAAFKVTRERIRQIEAKALRKLRHPSRSNLLKPYAGYNVRSYRNESSSVSSLEMRLLKLINLLQVDISHHGILTFMNMENLNWTIKELNKEVFFLEAMCEIAKESNLDPTTFKERVYSSRFIGFSSNFAKHLCENYGTILGSIRDYIETYIPSENKKRRI